VFRKVVVRIGSSLLSTVRRRIPRNRVALALGAVVLASLTTAVRAPATPNMQGAAREPASLREQVIHLFDRLDHVGQVIEGVRADIEWARARITELSGQIEAKQQLLNRRAAEAYMGLASGFDSALGASSVTDLRDTVEFIDAISQRDHDVLVALERRKGEFEQQQVRLEALEVELRQRRERLEATAADLAEKLQQQEALRARTEESVRDVGSAGGSPSSSPPAEPPPPTLAPPRAVVIALIRDRFASRGARTTDVALCVAERESNFDPLVVNPATGAAGVFQFMPSTWASLSEMAGWSGASVFDARANVAVAAWTVAHYGWHPWRSVAGDCGV
jgi:predicted  nucleic acid-binding Zn-ribbon protein